MTADNYLVKIYRKGTMIRRFTVPGDRDAAMKTALEIMLSEKGDAYDAEPIHFPAERQNDER